jgi:hypothetical protein
MSLAFGGAFAGLGHFALSFAFNLGLRRGRAFALRFALLKLLADSLLNLPAFLLALALSLLEALLLLILPALLLALALPLAGPAACFLLIGSLAFLCELGILIAPAASSCTPAFTFATTLRKTD